MKTVYEYQALPQEGKGVFKVVRYKFTENSAKKRTFINKSTIRKNISKQDSEDIVYYLSRNQKLPPHLV